MSMMSISLLICECDFRSGGRPWSESSRKAMSSLILLFIFFNSFEANMMLSLAGTFKPDFLTEWA